jgi:hypothetical protein
MSVVGQTFAFRRLNKRRFSNAEADQTLTSQACHFRALERGRGIQFEDAPNP